MDRFDMDRVGFWEEWNRTEMVLVGLGEEFDGRKRLRQWTEYEPGCMLLKKEGLSWLIPAWNEYCLKQSGETGIRAALGKLDTLLKGKNHFLVSVSTNSGIGAVGRNVMPCGSILRKQCREGCEDILWEVTEEEKGTIEDSFRELSKGKVWKELLSLGECPNCGSPLVLNTVYADQYNEKGYLAQWDLYKKWLQGTLNHKLLILELGVGMSFPSVIRWPFEKMAYFNKKAYFYRVHETLYQLTRELAGKGCGISEDAVDWLADL